MKQRTSSEIETVREELALYRMFVEDAELRGEISDWIEAVTSRDTASLEVVLRRELLELKRGFAMQYLPRHDNRYEGFPDACSECPHYGVRCPIVTDREDKQRRNRELSEAETQEEALRVWEDTATRHGCVRIPEWLGTWREEHSDLLREGYRLQSEVEDLTLDAEGDYQELPEELREEVEQHQESAEDALALSGGD